MKKVAVILGMCVLVAGCNVADKTIISDQNPPTKEKTELAKKDDESKNGSPDGCNAENMPRVESGKFGNILNLCGELTQFPAYDFDKEGFVLYEWSKWNEAEEKHEYMIKTIDKKPPFVEKDIVASSIPPGPAIHQGLYYWGAFGSGPGEARVVLIFKPETKEFVSADIFTIDDQIGASFNGSSASQELIVENEDYLAMIPEGMPRCMLLPFDILPESLSGRDENYQQEDRLALYKSHFPDNVPCVDGDGINIETGEVGPATGFFDLRAGKFVKN